MAIVSSFYWGAEGGATEWRVSEWQWPWQWRLAVRPSSSLLPSRQLGGAQQRGAGAGQPRNNQSMQSTLDNHSPTHDHPPTHSCTLTYVHTYIQYCTAIKKHTDKQHRHATLSPHLTHRTLRVAHPSTLAWL